MQNYIIDLTPDNFQQVLLDESMQRPVVIDFWADWCEPCKALTPLLEKLATEYQGKFLLAKVNCDEQQAIAGQFGIRNMPTVMVVTQGQPVDGFSGVQPEGAIRQMLEKYLPAVWEEFFQDAQALAQDGQLGDALAKLNQALELAEDEPELRLFKADLLLELNRASEAKVLLETILLQDQDSYYQSLIAKLELAQQAQDTPEIRDLEGRLALAPEDLTLRHQLAIQYHAAQRNEEALELLMQILLKDLNFADGAARKSLLDILATLETGNPLASRYRRKLYTLLH